MVSLLFVTIGSAGQEIDRSWLEPQEATVTPEAISTCKVVGRVLLEQNAEDACKLGPSPSALLELSLIRQAGHCRIEGGRSLAASRGPTTRTTHRQRDRGPCSSTDLSIRQEFQKESAGEPVRHHPPRNHGERPRTLAADSKKTGNHADRQQKGCQAVGILNRPQL